MQLRIRFKNGSTERLATERQPDENADLPLCRSSLALDRPSKAWSMLGSLAGHVFVVTLITVLSQHMSWLGYEEIDWSRYKEEPAPLRLRLSQPLVFVANRPAPSPKPRRSTRVEPAGAPGNAAEAAAAPKAGPSVPRRLELPVPRAVAQNAPIILQPEFEPKATPPVALPPLAYWARRTPDAPKPPRTEVVPGRTEAQAAPPKLAAPPVLAVPNRETMIAEMNVAMPQPPMPQPMALTLPNSATTPVRLRDAQENQAASFEVAPGQAVNVMAIPTERRDIRNVEIARGIQNIPNFTGDSAGSGGEHSATPGAAGGRGSASGSEATGTNTSANASGANPHPSTTAGGGRGGVSGNSAESAAGSSSASNGAVASANASALGVSLAPGTTVSRPLAPPEVTRIEHPTNGNFDVVVMQSGTRDDLPDLGGILSGNPVYSVYLRVGDQKEWLLEYCVPAREVAQNNPYQINLDEAGTITPPYPISTVIPTNLLGQQIGKNIVVHGYLTAAGSFQNIKSRDNHPFLPQLLTLLNQWQFRPALRNKKPIDVEIVLVIPPRV